MYARLFKDSEIIKPIDFKTAMDKHMRDNRISLDEFARQARENSQTVYDIYHCRQWPPTDRVVHAMGMLFEDRIVIVDDPAKKVVKTEEQKAEEHWQWKDSFPKE